jgi:hypothetical protein
VGENSEETLGDHGKGDVPVPGVVEPNLVVVEPDVSFPSLEAFLDGPSGARDPDEFTDGFVARVVAVVESEFAIIDGSADQVLVIGVVGVDDRPVIDTVTLRPDSTGASLPRVG